MEDDSPPHDPWAASPPRSAARARRERRAAAARREEEAGGGGYRRLAESAKKVAKKERRKRARRGAAKPAESGVRPALSRPGASAGAAARPSSMRRRSRSASASMRVRFQSPYKSPDSVSPTPLKRRLKLTPRTGRQLSAILPTPIAPRRESAGFDETLRAYIVPTPSGAASAAADDDNLSASPPPPPPTPPSERFEPTDAVATSQLNIDRISGGGDRRVSVTLPFPTAEGPPEPRQRQSSSPSLSSLDDGVGLPSTFAHLSSDPVSGIDEVLRLRKQTQDALLRLQRDPEQPLNFSDAASRDALSSSAATSPKTNRKTTSSSAAFTSRTHVSHRDVSAASITRPFSAAMQPKAKPQRAKNRETRQKKRTKKKQASTSGKVKVNARDSAAAEASPRIEPKVRTKKRQKKKKKDDEEAANTMVASRTSTNNTRSRVLTNDGLQETTVHGHERTRQDDGSPADGNEGGSSPAPSLASSSGAASSSSSDASILITEALCLDHLPLAEQQHNWSNGLRFSYSDDGSAPTRLSARDPPSRKARRARSVGAKRRRRGRRGGGGGGDPDDDYLPYAPLITSAMLLRSQYGQRRRDFISWDAHHARRYATIKTHDYYDGAGIDAGDSSGSRNKENSSRRHSAKNKKRDKGNHREFASRNRRFERRTPRSGENDRGERSREDALDGLGRAPSSSYGIQSPVKRHSRSRARRGTRRSSHSSRGKFSSADADADADADRNATSGDAEKDSAGRPELHARRRKTASRDYDVSSAGESKTEKVERDASQLSRLSSSGDVRGNTKLGPENADSAAEDGGGKDDVESNIKSLVSLSKIAYRLFAGGRSGAKGASAAGSGRSRQRGRNALNLWYASSSAQKRLRERRPRSPPPRRFRDIKMSPSDALALVEVPIIVPGKFTGRVDGYPVIPSVEDRLAECKLRVKRTGALIQERWASIHAARIILREPEEVPRGAGRRAGKPADAFLDSLASRAQARALWNRLRELVRGIKQREQREREFRRNPRLRRQEARAGKRRGRRLGFRGTSGATDLDNLRDKVVPRMRARLALFALKSHAKGRVRRRRMSEDLGARFRLLTLLHTFSALQMPSLESRAMFFSAVRMRRRREQKVARVVLGVWAAKAALRRKKRIHWANAMRMFLYRTQWRAMQAWRAAVAKKKALRVNLSIARRWHNQRYAMSVIVEWSKAARKQAMMKERIELLQGGRASVFGAGANASGEAGGGGGEPPKGARRSERAVKRKQIERSSRWAIPKTADVAAAVAASVDDDGATLTAGRGDDSVSPAESTSSLADVARRQAKGAAIALEQEWRESTSDLTGKNDAAVIERLRRKSLLLATKSVFAANRSRLQRRIQNIAREADRLSGHVLREVREERERSAQGRPAVEDSARDEDKAAAAKDTTAEVVASEIESGTGRRAVVGTDAVVAARTATAQPRPDATREQRSAGHGSRGEAEAALNGGASAGASATDEDDPLGSRHDRVITGDEREPEADTSIDTSFEEVQQRGLAGASTLRDDDSSSGRRPPMQSETLRPQPTSQQSMPSPVLPSGSMLTALNESASSYEDSPSPVRGAYRQDPTTDQTRSSRRPGGRRKNGIASKVSSKSLLQPRRRHQAGPRPQRQRRGLVRSKASFAAVAQEAPSAAAPSAAAPSAAAPSATTPPRSAPPRHSSYQQSTVKNDDGLNGRPAARSPIPSSMAAVFHSDNLHNQSLGSPLATASDDDSDMTSSGESNESSPSREHRGLMSTLASLFANKSRLRRAFSAFRHAARIFKAARVEIARRQRQVLGNYFRRGFVAAVRRAQSVRRTADDLHAVRVVRRVFRTWRRNVLQFQHAVHVLHMASILRARVRRWQLYCLGRRRRRFCVHAAATFRRRSLLRRATLSWRHEARGIVLHRLRCDALRWRVLRRGLLVPALDQWKEVHRRRALLYRVFAIAHTPSLLEVWGLRGENEMTTAEAMKQAWFEEWAPDLGSRAEVFIRRQENHGLVDLDERFQAQFHLMSKIMHAWRCYATGRAAWSAVLLRAHVFLQLRVYKLKATTFLGWCVVVEEEGFRRTVKRRVFREWSAMAMEAKSDRRRLVNGFTEYWGVVRDRRAMGQAMAALKGGAIRGDGEEEAEEEEEENGGRGDAEMTVAVQVRLPEVVCVEEAGGKGLEYFGLEREDGAVREVLELPPAEAMVEEVSLAPLGASLEEGQEDAGRVTELVRVDMDDAGGTGPVTYESDASTDIDISWADIEEEALSAFANVMLGSDVNVDAPVSQKNDEDAGEDGQLQTLSPRGLDAYNISSFPEPGQGGNVDVDGVTAAAVAAVHQHMHSR